MSKMSFSNHGRLIPSETSIVFAQEDRRYFALKNVTEPIEAIYKNIKEVFGELISISETDFVANTKKILDEIKSNDTQRGLLTGVYVPFVLPKKIFDKNLMNVLTILLDKLNLSYANKFPQYEFRNFAPDFSGTQFEIVSNSHLEMLYQEFQKNDLVGIYFPSVFTGYAVHSQRQLIDAFPQRCALSGPLEIASALLGYPSLLLRTDETYPNGLSCSGVKPKKQDQQNFFWYFESYGWNLNFNYRSMVGPPSEYFSGGLSFY